MIEVFKTNVRTRSEADQVASHLRTVLSAARINFDLQDCDKILRLEGIQAADVPVVEMGLAQLGFDCEMLI